MKGNNPRLRWIAVRYRTDPERIRRVLPPPLQPDDIAEVRSHWVEVFHEDESWDVFVPSPYHESDFFVTAKYQDKSGQLELGMPLDQDWGRHRGREMENLTKKDARIIIERNGDRLTASMSRRGKIVYQLDTIVTDQPAHPRNWLREYGWAGFRYRYSLNSDWRQGLIGSAGVELWKQGGRDTGYPTEMVKSDDPPLACDLSRTRFEFKDPSPLDPYCEFPVLEILGVSYYDGYMRIIRPQRTEGKRNDSVLVGGDQQRRVLEIIDPKDFEPWALFKFDRPIRKSSVQVPEGWPKSASAFKLSPEEIDAWRTKEAIAVDQADIVSIEYEVSPDKHARTLPSECQPGAEPRIRILGLQAWQSDISSQPFAELWLFSRCIINGQPAWYALSHVMGEHGDVFFGRDTFGYPSRKGNISVEVKEDAFSLSGHRLQRDFFKCRSPLGHSERTLKKDSFDVLGVRLFHVVNQPHRYEGRFVKQSWEIEMEMESLAGTSFNKLKIEMPETLSPGLIGKRDTWFELIPDRILSVSAGRGVIRRGPGVDSGSTDNLFQLSIERCDGSLEPLSALSGTSKATFFLR